MSFYTESLRKLSVRDPLYPVIANLLFEEFRATGLRALKEQTGIDFETIVPTLEKDKFLEKENALELVQAGLRLLDDTIAYLLFVKMIDDSHAQVTKKEFEPEKYSQALFNVLNDLEGKLVHGGLKKRRVEIYKSSNSAINIKDIPSWNSLKGDLIKYLKQLSEKDGDNEDDEDLIDHSIDAGILVDTKIARLLFVTAIAHGSMQKEKIFYDNDQLLAWWNHAIYQIEDLSVAPQIVAESIKKLVTQQQFRKTLKNITKELHLPPDAIISNQLIVEWIQFLINKLYESSSLVE